jgi:hypothetical protein
MNLSSQEERDKFFADFEKQGESAVRIATFSPAWNNDRYRLGMATEWLRLKDEERALAASKLRDAREEETLSIAREANEIARRSSREVRKDRLIAIAAVIIAAIAAIAARKEIWSSIQLIFAALKP